VRVYEWKEEAGRIEECMQGVYARSVCKEDKGKSIRAAEVDRSTQGGVKKVRRLSWKRAA
jgi:hypothetical protein